MRSETQFSEFRVDFYAFLGINRRLAAFDPAKNKQNSTFFNRQDGAIFTKKWKYGHFLKFTSLLWLVALKFSSKEQISRNEWIRNTGDCSFVNICACSSRLLGLFLLDYFKTG